MDYDAKICAKIKGYLAEIAMPQKTLGEKIGLRPGHIDKILKGDRPLKGKYYEAITRELGKSLTYFIEETNLCPIVVKFTPGERFSYDVVSSSDKWTEFITVPPGIDAQEAQNLYAVQLAVKSTRPVFREGTIFYAYKAGKGLPPEDGDYVVFCDADDTACLKQVSISNSSIILRSLNPAIPDIVKPKNYLHSLDTICCIRRPDSK